MEDKSIESGSRLSFDHLHSEVRIARPLFDQGHRQEAVRKAAERFSNRVAARADRPDLSGRSLMNHVFSHERPLLVFHEERTTLTEQNLHDGYHFLAVGLAVGVRNPYTHEDEIEVSEVEALEWLAFISAMHRRLDRAQQVEPDETRAHSEDQSFPTEPNAE